MVARDSIDGGANGCHRVEVESRIMSIMLLVAEHLSL